MNARDAASITYPFKEQPLDSPVTYWTDADEREYAGWLVQWRENSLWREFAEANADLFDEFCRDKFDAGRALDSDLARADAELDAEKERL